MGQAVEEFVITPPAQEFVITPPVTVDERGFRIMEGQGMPPTPMTYPGPRRTGIPLQELPGQFTSRLAEYYNVSTAGAPMDVILAGSYTMGAAADYQRLLRRYTGEGWDGEGITVYRHPELDELVYRNPRTKEITLIVDPTSSGQAAASVAAEVPTFMMETLAGVYSMRGGPTVVGMGMGAAAFQGKMLSLGTGKANGLNDYSSGRIVGEALSHTFWAVAAGFGVEVGASVMRRVMGSPQSKRFLDDLAPENIADAQKVLDDLADELERITGDRPNFTYGQVVQESGADERVVRSIRTFENRLAEESAELQAAEQSQRQVAEVLETRLFGDAPQTSTGAPRLAEEVSDIAAARLGAEREAIERETTAIIEEATEQVNRAFNQPDINVSADNIRVAMETARRDTFEALGNQYEAFWARFPEITADLAPLRATAAKWEATFESDIFRSLTSEDQAIIRDALRATAEEVPMANVSRALSLLKEERRAMGTTADRQRVRDKALLSDMISTLQGIRDSALRGVDPAAQAALRALDRNFSTASELMDGAMINRILTKNRNGGWKTPDNNTIAYLLGHDGRPAAALRHMVEQPSFPMYGSLQSIKDGAMALYQRDVIDGTMKHATFMRRYGAGMRNIFTETEMAPFRTAARAQTEITAAEARQVQLVDELKQRFDYTLENFDGDNLVQIIGASAAPVRRTRELLRILESHPDQLATYQGFRARKLREDVSSLNDLGQRQYDPNRLRNVIDNQGEELTLLYGEQYVADLNLMHRLSQLSTLPRTSWAQQFEALTQENPPATAALMFTRATIARPLSRAGLFLTGVLKIDSRAGRAATARLLADPKKLARAMNLYRRGASVEELLTVMGLDEYIDEMRQE